MSRWSDAFATLSIGHDTVDTLRQSGEADPVSGPDEPLYVPESPVLWKVEPTPTDDLQPGSTAPEPTILLCDGRRLHRFNAFDIPGNDVIGVKALMQEARGYGVGLWADGMDLVVVEQWGRILPVPLFDELRQHAGAVIAELRRESRARCDWQVFDPPAR